MSRPIAAIVTASSTRNASALCAYVSDKKSGQKEDRFVFQTGINGTSPAYASAQMRRNRQKFGKDGSRLNGGNREGQYVQAHHVIQSFGREGEGSLDPKNPDDLITAHELGLALARDIAGDDRLATVTTQIDGKTGCVHNHVVIDSISKVDGKSMPGRTITHKNLAPRADQVLLDQGYKNVNILDKARDKKTVSEVREHEQHANWQAKDSADTSEPFSVAVLKQRIAATMADPRAIDAKSLRAVAREHGVDLRLTQTESGRLGASYRMIRRSTGGRVAPPDPRGIDRRAASKLGTAFSRSALDRAIEANRQRARQARREVAQETPTVAPVARVEPVAPVVKSTPSKPARRAPVKATKRAVPVAQEPVEEAVKVGSAPAVEYARPIVIKPAFVSQLRGVEAVGSQAKQDEKTLEELAAFEEDALKTETFTEAKIPPRVTKRFMDDYGENLTPDVREPLTRRAEKLALAAKYYDDGKRYIELGGPVADIGRTFQAETKLLREEAKRGDYDLAKHSERKNKDRLGKDLDYIREINRRTREYNRQSRERRERRAANDRGGLSL